MRIINFSKEADYKNIIELIGKQHYNVQEIDSTGLIGIEPIYEQLITKLPVGIPLSGKIHWDAFLDSIWEGITEQGITKLVLIWHGSESIMKESLSDFITIIGILNQLSVSLYEADPKCEFICFLLGNEYNYK